MNDALVGLQKSATKYTMEPDRRKAIAIALQHAAPGDIVLLAGKGHEKVQVTKHATIPFDDVEVARESLKALGYELAQPALDDAFRRFKELADKKKHVFDEDISALVDDSLARGQERTVR